MKKRFIVAALAIAGAMTLSGCGGGSKSSSEPAADSKTAQSEGTKKQMEVRKYLLFSLVLRLRQLTPRSIHQLTEETIFYLPLTIF